METSDNLEELAMRRELLMLRASRWFLAKAKGQVRPQEADDAIYTISEQLNSMGPNRE